MAYTYQITETGYLLLQDGVVFKDQYAKPEPGSPDYTPAEAEAEAEAIIAALNAGVLQ